jgi:uncharacterized protein with GYD domain
MKYVMLGVLGQDSLQKQKNRTTTARTKLKSLGMSLESVYYTQGPYDFVDVVNAPSAEAMLAFSVWYGEQGYGKVISLPAFDERTFVTAMAKGGLRGKRRR